MYKRGLCGGKTVRQPNDGLIHVGEHAGCPYLGGNCPALTGAGQVEDEAHGHPDNIQDEGQVPHIAGGEGQEEHHEDDGHQDAAKPSGGGAARDLIGTGQVGLFLGAAG